MQLIINGEAREIDGAGTVAELIEVLDLGDQRLAVEHNGEIVPRSQHGQAELDEGDRLEIVHAVGGG